MVSKRVINPKPHLRRTQPIQLAVEAYYQEPSEANAETLMKELDKFLWRYCHSLNTSRRLAPDVMQDLRLVAWKSLKQYTPEKALFTTYLHKALLGAIRKRTNKEIEISKHEIESPLSGPISTDDEVHMWQSLEDNIDLKSALSELTPIQQQILYLMFFEDKKMTEIGVQLDMTAIQVEKEKTNGLIRLRTLMSRRKVNN